MSHDDYPSGESDTVLIECPECNGEGWTVEPGCCMDQDYVSHGNCCGNAIPVQVECKHCYKGQIEISKEEARQQGVDNEADLLRDDC